MLLGPKQLEWAPIVPWKATWAYKWARPTLAGTWLSLSPTHTASVGVLYLYL